MNDRYDAGHGSDSYELVGYDEFGQPVYRQVPAQYSPQAPQDPQGYDPYGAQSQQGQQQSQGYGYGYDPYAQQPADPYDPAPSPSAYHDPYGGGHGGGAGQAAGPGYDGYDPYGQGAGTGQQQTHTAVQHPQGAHGDERSAYIPHQGGSPESVQEDGQGERGRSDEGMEGADGREYHTEQFAFVEEPDGDSEDVIDWLAFTENRTERREEAKRRARGRLVALVVALALVAAGGVGYLWFAGKLPGSSGDGKAGTTTAAGAQKREVLVVHLRNTGDDGTSTALLVNNTTTERGATVLLPNSLALTDDEGTTTTLAKSVEDDGASGTREALHTVLGTDIEGTWRLDTPYLNNLVELVGNIEVDTDTDVPDPDAKKGAAPLVNKGEAQTLSGRTAVAYATYRASGEPESAQLERFGQVMQGVLRKLSSDAQAATVTMQTLAQILDPPLTDSDLGTFLAGLAERAKGGDYETASLPVQEDGTLDAETSDSVVKELLGGTAKSPEAGDAVRVAIRNATGDEDATEQARVVLLNGGYTFLDAGTASAAGATSEITYADDASKEEAVEVAKTLGLPTGSVVKGSTTSNADVSVVLGQDYEVTGPAG
ncbi:LCP family protein [Streptomyces sp. CRN 30]|uniref:LCP family protein n=1 Tax=Streptomyces sp. CRN 30 TaxID=3075613 RepID=UPI002A81EC65|nr:LCP family protein [Streptomyces sp. CRN 30]